MYVGFLAAPVINQDCDAGEEIFVITRRYVITVLADLLYTGYHRPSVAAGELLPVIPFNPPSPISRRRIRQTGFHLEPRLPQLAQHDYLLS